jgi:glycosyltransferase involved in cell wall biosynthesis
MRVLILADDCNPEWPSLPIVGFKAARAIAECADVVVATHVRNRPNIEKTGLGKAAVRYIDNEYVARPVHRLSRLLRGGTSTSWTTAMAMAYPGYLAFEWEVWRQFRTDLRCGRFDVVHRLTPMSPTIPSPMARWSPVPFVLGPLNGGLPWPPAYRAELAREREWLTHLRSAYRYLPYVRSTFDRSAAILAAFAHTAADLPASAASRIVSFPEVGIDPELFDRPATRPRRERKTVLFVGRLVPYKLPQVVVRAFAASAALRAHRLVLVGDGPERQAIEALVREHALEHCVELLGWLPQPQVADCLRDADVFAFPSIRELGAGALVEAMATALTCVVVDYGAPGSLIASDRGVKVPLAPIDELVPSFAMALQQVLADDDARAEKGRAARLHALGFYSWAAKAHKALEVYRWVTAGGRRPEFFQALPQAVA